MDSPHTRLMKSSSDVYSYEHLKWWERIEFWRHEQMICLPNNSFRFVFKANSHSADMGALSIVRSNKHKGFSNHRHSFVQEYYHGGNWPVYEGNPLVTGAFGSQMANAKYISLIMASSWTCLTQRGVIPCRHNMNEIGYSMNCHAEPAGVPLWGAHFKHDIV